MSEGIHNFDGALQTSNVWLKEIMQELHTENTNEAYAAMRSVLHALRDRLPAAEAIHLGSQLPLVISGVYYDGFRLREKPVKYDQQQILSRIREDMRQYPQVDPNRMSGAVIKVLARHVSEGELSKIEGTLPEDLRSWWRATRDVGSS